MEQATKEEVHHGANDIVLYNAWVSLRSYSFVSSPVSTKVLFISQMLLRFLRYRSNQV